MIPKSLMTHYIEGSIVSRELENMMADSAAEVRFDQELSDLEFWADHAPEFHIHLHRGNTK